MFHIAVSHQDFLGYDFSGVVMEAYLTAKNNTSPSLSPTRALTFNTQIFGT